MVDRIKTIMEYKELTPAQFADSIGINRSNLTHLFSGRNMPSLDLVRKILTTYTDISTEWLIMNVGNMFKEENLQDNDDLLDNSFQKTASELQKRVLQPDLFDNIIALEATISSPNPVSSQITDSGDDILPDEKEEKVVPEDDKQEIETESRKKEHPLEEKSQINKTIKEIVPEKLLQKVIFFYSDKTFDIYYPGE